MEYNSGSNRDSNFNAHGRFEITYTITLNRTSFDYNYQNPSYFSFLIPVYRTIAGSLPSTGITKFKFEKENVINSRLLWFALLLSLNFSDFPQTKNLTCAPCICTIIMHAPYVCFVHCGVIKNSV